MDNSFWTRLKESNNYAECVELLEKDLEKEDDNISNVFLKQNTLNFYKCLLFIARSKMDGIEEMEMELYRFYNNVTAVGLPDDLVPLSLELTALYNFIWWHTFYKQLSPGSNLNIIGILPVIQKGLRRVLGIPCKLQNYENIVQDLCCDIMKLKEKFKFRDSESLLILSEVITLTFLYIFKLNKNSEVVGSCVEAIKSAVHDVELLQSGLKAVEDIAISSPVSDKLFKFGFTNIKSFLSCNQSFNVEGLKIISAVSYYLTGKYKEVLNIFKKVLSSEMKVLWCYIGGLSAFMLQDYDRSFGFVLMISGVLIEDAELKSRLEILKGRLLSRRGEFPQALKCFSDAKQIFPDLEIASYYLGEEYGKIGLSEEMMESFIDLLKLVEEKLKKKQNDLGSSFQSSILKILHSEEVTLGEAAYAAAVACGLNEKYKLSLIYFTKFIERIPFEGAQFHAQDRLVKTPSLITAFHEAATMSILTGNAQATEDLLQRGFSFYEMKEIPESTPKRDLHVSKNVNWIKEHLERELGVVEEGKGSESANLYTEEMVYFFEVDIIGLMLSAEVQSEERKIVLGKTISALSKYLAQMQRKDVITLEERVRWNLVKAITAKTCLLIAREQMKSKSSAEIEKTFKRALTCNNGDKDVLFEYYNHLTDMGKKLDAEKLWKMFRWKESILNPDSCQSLALRYLLKQRVSNSQLENVELDMECSPMDCDMSALP